MKTSSKILKILKHPWPLMVFEISMLTLGVLTTVLYYLHFEKIFGNSASRFLLVIGPYVNIGRPYNDLWEFVPPGFLALSSSWVYIFGWGMSSFRMLQIVILAVIGISFLLIAKKLFKTWVIEIPLFASFVLIFYSPLLQTDMLSIELFAIVFALVALVSLLYINNIFTKLFVSSFLFFMASQMKETLTFSIVALAPYYLSLFFQDRNLKKFSKYIVYGLLGIVFGILLIVLYLYVNDSIAGYKGILDYKLTRVIPFGTLGSILATMRHIENLFSEWTLHFHDYLRNLVILSMAVIVIQASLKMKFKKLATRKYSILVNFRKINKISWQDWSGLLFSSGIFLGLIMYNQYSVDARLIPVCVAFFIVAGVSLQYLYNHALSLQRFKKMKRVIPFATFFILLLIMSPQTRIFKSFFHQIKLHISAEFLGHTELRAYYVRTSSLEVNRYIKQNTTIDDCILNPYGWEVAETYIYSERKPCTRYFLVNMALSNANQIKEYREEVLANPPTLIFYNVNVIDLNVESFSETVIDYPNAIKHCYTLDEQFKDYPYTIAGSLVKINLYWRNKNLTDDQLKECFVKYATPKVVK